MKFLFHIFLILVVFTFSKVSFSQSKDIPYLTGRVNDAADLLSEQTINKLTQTLSQHEANTSNQVVVLTIASLEGENLEDYTNRVFEAWSLGQKNKDNGVLLLISKNDRKLRIEVGYGLESILTDAKSSRIIRNSIVPYLKKGNYNKGVLLGVDAIIMVLNGNEVSEFIENNYLYNNSPVKTPKSEGVLKEFKEFFSDLFKGVLSSEDVVVQLIVGIVFYFFMGIFAFSAYFTKEKKGSLFLFFFLFPFLIIFPIILFGITIGPIPFAIYVIGYVPTRMLLKRNPRYYLKQVKGSSSSSGSSSWSSSRSSFSSSSSSSGGGFSGGGGSSGGGGASGSW